MSVREFGVADGEPVREITIRAPKGSARAKVLTWGAVLRDMLVPLPSGELQRVVLGFDSLDAYIAHSPHMGAIAGRVANRIGHGRFTIDGTVYEVDRNQDGRHTLHGGMKGFGKRPWQLAHHDDSSVTLTLLSPDGDHGFPGNVTVTCVYRLLEPATLRIELSATTDRPTPVNLAHHSYFNLDGSPSILDHRMRVEADFITATDADLIPTGEIRSVEGTPYDFRGNRSIRFPDAETGAPVHYDINFVLRRTRLEPSGIPGMPLAHAALVTSLRNNLALDVWTTAPGLQVYDGRKIDLSGIPGLDGAIYGSNAGLALEPQHFPNSINIPHFPSVLLTPGDVYRQVSEFRFHAG